MILKNNTYGETVRAARENAGIGLREFAKKLKITPTYQSKVERNELNPPAEGKIKETASNSIVLLSGGVFIADIGSIISNFTAYTPFNRYKASSGNLCRFTSIIILF